LDTPEELGPFLVGRLQQMDGSATYGLTGELDLAGAEALVSRLVELGSATPGPVRLNLGGLVFMDSSGLQALLDAKAALEAAGRRLVVVTASEPVTKVLEMTGMDKPLGEEPG
jgi:anti-anti-sigma factor